VKAFDYTITSPNGLHMRPAGLFSQKMQEFKSSIVLKRDEQEADTKKLMAIMKLRPKCGQLITVSAQGEDEDAAIEAAKEFLTANL